MPFFWTTIPGLEKDGKFAGKNYKIQWVSTCCFSKNLTHFMIHDIYSFNTPVNIYQIIANWLENMESFWSRSILEQLSVITLQMHLVFFQESILLVVGLQCKLFKLLYIQPRLVKWHIRDKMIQLYFFYKKMIHQFTSLYLE